MVPKIFSIKEDGKKREYDVILTFKSEIYKKDYVVYTDNSYDEYGKLKIFVAEYNPLTNEFIKYVEDRREYTEAYKLLDKVFMNRKNIH